MTLDAQLLRDLICWNDGNLRLKEVGQKSNKFLPENRKKYYFRKRSFMLAQIGLDDWLKGLNPFLLCQCGSSKLRNITNPSSCQMALLLRLLFQVWDCLTLPCCCMLLATFLTSLATMHQGRLMSHGRNWQLHTVGDVNLLQRERPRVFLEFFSQLFWI